MLITQWAYLARRAAQLERLAEQRAAQHHDAGRAVADLVVLRLRELDEQLRNLRWPAVALEGSNDGKLPQILSTTLDATFNKTLLIIVNF